MTKDIALRFCLNSLYRRSLNSYFSLNHLNDTYPGFCLFVKKKSVNATLLRPPSHHGSNFVRTEKVCTFADVVSYLHQTMATKRYYKWALCPQVTAPAPVAAAAPAEKKQEEAEKPAAKKKEPAKSETNKK